MPIDLLGLLPDIDSHAALGAEAYWGAADVAAAVAHAVGSGASVHTPTSDVGVGIVPALVQAPDGSLASFVCNPNFRLP
jgi:hypothetical protein